MAKIAIMSGEMAKEAGQKQIPIQLTEVYDKLSKIVEPDGFLQILGFIQKISPPIRHDHVTPYLGFWMVDGVLPAFLIESAPKVAARCSSLSEKVVRECQISVIKELMAR